jgi:hypothetical protein
MLYLQTTSTKDISTIIVQKIPGVLWHFVHDRENFIQKINGLVCLFSAFMTIRLYRFHLMNWTILISPMYRRQTCLHFVMARSSPWELNGNSIAQKEFAEASVYNFGEWSAFTGLLLLPGLMQQLVKTTGIFGIVLFPYHKYGNWSTTPNLKDNTSWNLFPELSQKIKTDDFGGQTEEQNSDKW